MKGILNSFSGSLNIHNENLNKKKKFSLSFQRNLVKNGMWPTSLWNLGFVVATVAIVMVTDYPQMEGVNDRFWGFGEYFYISRGKWRLWNSSTIE